MSDGPRHAFVCGCPRSGTTLLARLLNAHPDLAMGIERYGNLFMREPLTPALFTPDRFFDLRAGDTFYDSLDFSPVYAAKRARFGEVAVVGDKIPLLFRHLEQLRAGFPDAKVVFCVRNLVDVAASWQARADDAGDATWRRDRGAAASVGEWNAALEAFLAHRDRLDMRVFDHDLFAARGRAQLRGLVEWLGLDWGPAMVAAVAAAQRRAVRLEAERTRSLPGPVLRDLLRRGATHLYRRALR